MNFYSEYVLPHVIHCACGMKAIDRQRAKVVPRASGRVLEVGMGSGLNLPYYRSDNVEIVWGLEPSLGMQRKAQRNISASPIDVKWLEAGCEAIPLEDDEADSVVLTYTLCTVPDPKAALEEIKRVLKPKGQIFFSEHGLAPDLKLQGWQRRLNPIWKRLAGGCNLNRDITALISNAGFRLLESDNMFVSGPKIATYQYWGVAQN